MGTSRMGSVPDGYEYPTMEILIAIGAILSGLVTVAVGMFSLAAIFFDDLVCPKRRPDDLMAGPTTGTVCRCPDGI